MQVLKCNILTYTVACVFSLQSLMCWWLCPLSMGFVSYLQCSLSKSVSFNQLHHYISWQMPRIKKCIACMKAYFSLPYSSCQLHTGEPTHRLTLHMVFKKGMSSQCKSGQDQWPTTLTMTLVSESFFKKNTTLIHFFTTRALNHFLGCYTYNGNILHSNTVYLLWSNEA